MANCQFLVMSVSYCSGDIRFSSNLHCWKNWSTEFANSATDMDICSGIVHLYEMTVVQLYEMLKKVHLYDIVHLYEMLKKKLKKKMQKTLGQTQVCEWFKGGQTPVQSNEHFGGPKAQPEKHGND